ncbi:hypothetical protein EES46_07905 [Streptomyces sp. ADI98-10]|nr:hypothetical protein EES46_07905 [Streptomyces sp. ADI98-10]
MHSGHLVHGGVHQVRGLAPGVQIQAADGAGQFGVLRDDIGGVPGLQPPPGQREPGAGVDPAGEQRGHVDGDPGGGGDKVGGQVRPGGVPAGSVERDLQPVAGRGDGPDPQPDPPDVHLRVAVHADDPPDAFQHPGRDRVDRTAGEDLLGGLEDQPHGVGQQPLPVEPGEHESRPEHGGGVHVVPAGVRPVGHGGPVGHARLGVRDRQRVDVRPQRQHGRHPVPLPHVTHEPGPDGENLRLQPGLLQPVLDGGGGTELLVAELGMHVQIPAEGDQLSTEFVGEPAGQRTPGLAGRVVGAGGAGLQLVHLMKRRPLAPSTGHRSTKLQPLRRTNFL